MSEQLSNEAIPIAVVATWRKPSLAIRVAILLILLGIALVGLDAWQLWRARADQMHDSEVAAANLAKSLSQHAYDTFKEADTVLVGLVERMEYANVDQDALIRLHALLVTRVKELPQLHGLFIYDADGKWLANSQPGKPASLNNSDREYFQYHKTHLDRTPHIGTPIRSKSNGEWIVTISRRVNSKSGEFAGVILATIRMDYFKRYYQDFDVGRHGAVLVATNTGRILLRRPFDVSYFDKNISNGPLFSKFLPQESSGTNVFTSAVDGVTRINSHRRVPVYPLVVLAALSQEDVLAGWKGDVITHGVVLTLLIMSLGFLGWRLTRQINRRTKAETALRKSQAALEAANASLEKLALQDGLTGLANRRCFDTTLLREFSRATRDGTAISLILIDVDKFKQYNDLYGHASGDTCLRQVSAAVASAVHRPCDLSARYGGEELVVLLPGTDIAGAKSVAESIRARVEALAVEHRGSDAGFVTVSAGVASVSGVGVTSKSVDFIERADRALYQAKSQGRNRVCITTEAVNTMDVETVPAAIS